MGPPMTESESSMLSARSSRLFGVALVLAAAVGLGALLAGCTTPTPTGGTTAKANLPVAQATLTTTAPDAKLLVVQTIGVASATSTPSWGYLFGSPKTNKLYVVAVQNGKTSTQEYGTAKLSAQEWAAVPGTVDKWQVDSDVAHQKAAEKYGAQGATSPYIMGFVTYIPKTSTSTAEPYVWSVTFDPEKTGNAKARTFDVNATDGTVKAAK